MSLTAFMERDDAPVGDQFVHLRVSWDDYERVLAMRGDRSGPRICYLDGVLEIMSPSEDHEKLKSRIGRLVEAWCLHHAIPFEPVGNWTLKERKEESGVEPDECYKLRTLEGNRPHLAIEVIWTHGGIGKLEIYRRLGVPEVWIWRKGRLAVHRLIDGSFQQVEASEALPGLDVAWLATFLDRSTYQAIVDFRVALESRTPG